MCQFKLICQTTPLDSIGCTTIVHLNSDKNSLRHHELLLSWLNQGSNRLVGFKVFT